MNGDGTTDTSWTPVPVAGVSGAVGVAAGVGHACAVLSTGGVLCWGSGYGGDLGNGTGRDSLIPVAVTGL
jgi:alpha-tubulin suppressor-like RCC1 family protein